MTGLYICWSVDMKPGSGISRWFGSPRSDREWSKLIQSPWSEVLGSAEKVVRARQVVGQWGTMGFVCLGPCSVGVVRH